MLSTSQELLLSLQQHNPRVVQGQLIFNYKLFGKESLKPNLKSKEDFCLLMLPILITVSEACLNWIFTALCICFLAFVTHNTFPFFLSFFVCSCLIWERGFSPYKAHNLREKGLSHLHCAFCILSSVSTAKLQNQAELPQPLLPFVIDLWWFIYVCTLYSAFRESLRKTSRNLSSNI